MKHTNGEWFVSGQTEVVSMPSQCKIAKVSGWNYEEAHANSKLIAAAPDLLEALIYMVENAPKWYSSGEEFDIELAKTAIKKATE